MAEKSRLDQISSILRQCGQDPSIIINQLDEIIKKKGLGPVRSWENEENSNTLIHELAEKNLGQVIQYLALQYDVDVRLQRKTDGKTPREIAKHKGYKVLEEDLEELENNQALKVSNENEDDDEHYDTPDELDRNDLSDRDEQHDESYDKYNIVWVDLEFTSLDDPKIMECAVIITDKNLKPLAEGEWVIHYDQNELDTLGEWQQEHFASSDQHGNGLFKDCLKSTLTEKDVEERLLELLKRFCPPQQCPLAGSSIHSDKTVLKKRMPRVDQHLNFRIIDVSSFRAMLKRWAPRTESRFMKELSDNGDKIVSHRAMDDIIWSIKLMKLFRPLLAPNPLKKHKYPMPNHIRGKNEVTNGAVVINRASIPTELYPDEKTLLARLELYKNTDVKKLKLEKRYENIYQNNPHLREIFISGGKLTENNDKFEKQHRYLEISSRVHVEDIPKRMNVTTECWLQRKLCVTEIEFLTNYSKGEECLVIYVGAATAVYLNYLVDLFPNVEFIFSDMTTVNVKKSGKVHIRSQQNLNDWIKDYCRRGKKLLLICNVYTNDKPENVDMCIRNDLENQISWHEKLKPEASLLTLRVSRTGDKTRFFDGDIVLEPWCSRQSTSCRLVVLEKARLTFYENRELMQSLSHFHNVRRLMYYCGIDDALNVFGYDHCYDCRAEIFILERYLVKVQKAKLHPTTYLRCLEKMSTDISNAVFEDKRISVVGGKRTLMGLEKQ